MTNINTAIGAAMQLADQYAAAHAKWALEDLYGTSKSYTAKMLKERHALRSHLAAALASAAAPVVQPGIQVTRVELTPEQRESLRVKNPVFIPGVGASRGQAPALHAVQWQCGPQANGFTAPQADSVLEGAVLLKEARDALWQPANVALCERIDAYLDAASKQGANHD